MIDETHDAGRRSFVASANGHADFPLQNLPIGVFSTLNDDPQGGIAIGDFILDLRLALAADLFDGTAQVAAEAGSQASLNAFLALGAAPRQALRRRLFALLADDTPSREAVIACLHDASSCRLHLPARIGDYTDFYVGIHHARNIGQLFRPDNPLLPNYKHVPIGYHGRASSICPSGAPVRRPNGQTKALDAPAPEFGPSRRLDYELELGVWIGPGNAQGDGIPVGNAAEHAAGYCLLNDWSARDIQAWEYQPLGPFLSKSFGSTISPWIIMPEALTPFRTAQAVRPAGDPTPLPYLLDSGDQAAGAFDLELDVLIRTEAMRRDDRPAFRLARSNARHMYWTVAQMIAHHTSNGCDLQPGDLLGTGTISGPDIASHGSLIEATQAGRTAIVLPNGEERHFLEDGDEVILQARAHRNGFASIGFGDCSGIIQPAAAAPR